MLPFDGDNIPCTGFAIWACEELMILDLWTAARVLHLVFST